MRTLIAPLGLALGLLSALAISPGLAQQTKPQPRLEGGDEIVEHARAEDMALPRERFRAIQFEGQANSSPNIPTGARRLRVYICWIRNSYHGSCRRFWIETRSLSDRMVHW